jgi:phage repressor protein C with HTH and peptisase S24 domain
MREAGFDSQSALARASGVPQPTINRILQNVGKKGPEASTLQKLAAACNVTFEWLHEGSGQKARTSASDTAAESAAPLPAGSRRVRAVEPDDPSVAHIRKVQLRVSAGVMGFRVDPEYDDGETVSLDLRWVARKRLRSDKLVAIAVKGESMEPSLYEDDVVIIDTADTAKQDGAVYVFNYEGEVVVKRLSRDAGEWWLTSDSPDQRKYHRKVCRDRECIIVGRVVRKESDRI